MAINAQLKLKAKRDRAAQIQWAQAKEMSRPRPRTYTVTKDGEVVARGVRMGDYPLSVGITFHPE